MNLIKQFLELGGFEKIEHASSLSEAKNTFVSRYSAAYFDPDDLSLNTEISSRDENNDFDREIQLPYFYERRNKGGKS